jgi:hypothetical protein
MTGGVRSMTMADARKFMSSSSEILLSDFAVLADARRRPVFPVFRSAPSHMIAAIHRAYDKRRERRKTVPKPNLQPDFNVSVFEWFDTSSSAGLRELDESDRSVQKSAESTLI